MQQDCMPLVYELQTRGYTINIETNGSIEINDEGTRSYHYTMDIKCPSSGMSAKNRYDNLERLKSADEVKFVISNLEDYVFAKEILETYKTKARILFSPVFNADGTNTANELAELLMLDKLYGVRLGVQIHKLINIY